MRSARTSPRCTARACPRTRCRGSPTGWWRTCRPGLAAAAGDLRGDVHRRDHVKVRDGQVGNQPFYAAIGVDLAGRRDVLGLWAGQHGGGESAKFWMDALTDLRNRGVRDVFFVVCDGLTGCRTASDAVFPAAIVQTCVIHLIRGSFRYASRHYWEQLGALACGHFEVAHREGAAGLHDVADGLDRVSGGGCEEVDLVFDREYLVGVEEQCERRVAAGAVGDGAGSTLSSWPRP